MRPRAIIFVPSIGWPGWALLVVVWLAALAVGTALPGLPFPWLLQGAAIGAGTMYLFIRRLLLRIIEQEDFHEAETVEEALNAPEPPTGVRGEVPPALDDAMREKAQWN